MLQFSLRSAVFCWFESSITMDTRWILQDAVLFHQHKQKAGIRGRSARWRLLYKAFSAANWRKSGHKSARRKRPSTQYPPRQMPAQRMGLNFLQKLLISTKGSLSLFQRRRSWLFLWENYISTEEQVIVSTEEASHSPRNWSWISKKQSFTCV